MSKIYLIISLEEGPKIIINKNIAILDRVFLITYSINFAKKQKIADEIFVSPNYSNISYIAKTINAKILDKPLGLTENLTSIQEAINFYLRVEKFLKIIFFINFWKTSKQNFFVDE